MLTIKLENGANTIRISGCVLDYSDVLTGTFTSSEVGKLYLVLARALGRLE